jgi:uncharacterized protein YbaR (Trm112 family)
MDDRFRRRLARLETLVMCPSHREQILICRACDLATLSMQDHAELAELLHRGGFLAPAYLSTLVIAGDCWRCGQGALMCPACNPVYPPEFDRLADADQERLAALAERLMPPWLRR